MPAPSRPLGVLKPLGGGDAVPLLKDEILIGRRPTCDIRLDFENVSGKHCQLRYVQGVWRIRDLGSTNGTTINGHDISHDHSVMPDDELGIATHYFSIDYDPAVAPGTLIDANQFLDEEDVVETRRARSLMELAGLESGSNAPPMPMPKAPKSPDQSRPPAASKDESFHDSIPDTIPVERIDVPSDDDFFEMIKQDVQEPKDDRRPKRR